MSKTTILKVTPVTEERLKDIWGEKEPILCRNCGFDKNRPRGHIFLSDKNFIFEHTITETARCSECGHVRDWIETGNNPKTARIIYRNFDGKKKYFEKVEIDVKKQGYLISKKDSLGYAKKDSLGYALEDMFIQNPEPSQEKQLFAGLSEEQKEKFRDDNKKLFNNEDGKKEKQKNEVIDKRNIIEVSEDAARNYHTWNWENHNLLLKRIREMEEKIKDMEQELEES